MCIDWCKRCDVGGVGLFDLLIDVMLEEICCIEMMNFGEINNVYLVFYISVINKI